MLMRLALAPTAEAAHPTVAGEAAGLVEEEDRGDTKSPGRLVFNFRRPSILTNAAQPLKYA
jgi:hypothetical protein